MGAMMMGLGLVRRRLGVAGNAAVEFGFIAPVMLIMLMGTADYGLEVYYNAQLQRAVRAGAQYATKYSTDQTGIATTIQQASKLTGIVVPTLVTACKCADGTVAACAGGTCADGSSVGNYVTISGTYTYTPFLHFFSSAPRTLTSSVSIRTS